MLTSVSKGKNSVDDWVQQRCTSNLKILSTSRERAWQEVQDRLFRVCLRVLCLENSCGEYCLVGGGGG